MNNKKGIIQFGIIAIAIAVIVVGFLAFNPFKAKAAGLTEEQVKKLLDEKQTNQQSQITCGAGTQLQNNKCETTNNNEAQQQTTAQPSIPPSTLAPPAATNVVCREPSGVFTSLYYRQRNFIKCGAFEGFTCKAQVWGKFKYQGNCAADIYIESGIPNAPQTAAALAIAPYGFTSATEGKPSSCDGNKNWNGVVFNQLKPNEEVIFKLTPENYNVEGTYPITVNAYTGCFKDGGKEIQGYYKPMFVGFSNSYERGTSNPNKDIDLSWVKLA